MPRISPVRVVAVAMDATSASTVSTVSPSWHGTGRRRTMAAVLPVMVALCSAVSSCEGFGPPVTNQRRPIAMMAAPSSVPPRVLEQHHQQQQHQQHRRGVGASLRAVPDDDVGDASDADEDDEEYDAETATTAQEAAAEEAADRRQRWPSFADLGVVPAVLTAIRAQPHWDRPTPVQELAIPKLLQRATHRGDGGDDGGQEEEAPAADAVWCEAPTGSGKTAVFAIPLLQNLLFLKAGGNNNNGFGGNGSGQQRGRIASLILCPTRELAVQTGTVVDQLAYNLSKMGPTRKAAARRGGETTTTEGRRHGRFAKSGGGRDGGGRDERDGRPDARMIRTMVLHGGVPLQPQISELADCARFGTQIDVLVATPGRLVDVLTYYSRDGRGGSNSARDAALERRLLEALDGGGGGAGGAAGAGKDASVSLERLQLLGLDDFSRANGGNGGDGGDDGRSNLVNLLGGLQFLVIDEADRILGKPFQSELDSILELLPSYRATAPSDDDKGGAVDAGGKAIASHLSTWLFSATFPKTIEPRLDQVLTRLGAKSPLRIECAHSDRVLSDDVPISSSLRKKLDRSSTVAAASNYQQVGPASTIHLRTVRLEKRDRTQALRKLLEDEYGPEEWDRVMVFVSTRYAAEHVSHKLRRAGIKSNELHGKLDQDARLRRLEDLKRGKVRVLVCTDVASRGIDISGLAAVVNYDLPRSTADFVHRIGRTGRAGLEGTAVSFVTPSSDSHMDLIEQRHLASPTLREVMPGFEPNEERWQVEADGSRTSAPGTMHSSRGLDHDRMFGGIKGHRRSKKDKLREATVRQAEK